MDKRHILTEIKRIASTNGGKPPGRELFAKETGIAVSEWYPHLWLRWGDALAEAGLPANQFGSKMDVSLVLDKYIEFIRELGRVPLSAELKVKARSDSSFPSHGVFDGHVPFAVER